MEYTGWELEHFDRSKNFRHYQYSLIKNYVKDNILEVGAGNASFLETNNLIKKFSKIELTDINYNFYKKLKEKYKDTDNIKVYNKKINEIDSNFETIFYLDVVEHIEDDKAEILKAFNKLNTGGHLIIMVPAFQYLYSDYDKEIGHYRRYKTNFFKEFAKENNIKCKKLIYFDCIGFFFLIINKLIKIKGSSKVGFGTLVWNILVPISRILDKILLHSVGKSILCVYKK